MRHLDLVLHPGLRPFAADNAMGDRLTVPPTMRPLLFGKTRGTTFAVLDGSLIDGLSEGLAASGLSHSCLFQGDARDEWGDKAPWLVQLDAGSDLTRGLLTDDDTHWTWWGPQTGLILRCALPLDDLKRHLRRYLRLQDAAGNWGFWRFWDGIVWRAIAGLDDGPWIDGWPINLLQPVDTAFFVADGQLHQLTLKEPSARAGPPILPFGLRDLTRSVAARPRVAPALRHMVGDHWLLPLLGATALNPHLSDGTLERLIDLPPESDACRLCRSVAADRALTPFIRATTLRYLARMIDRQEAWR
ncbi:DUF4123 domain-containing protein [Jannaschia marina]|uniref:DUF4123 domain-containing protein n=1 Tax=Jannaschia marina TaxID=2741674 RepID=UPI0015CD2085|nr:DUF4123 domain-containing protein [Jannaschia marina]